MADYQEIHKKIEFDEWAYQEGLLKSEQYLIDKYLDKSGKTLEAGTAGGRIILELKKLGFSSLYGFDYVSEFIEVAKNKSIYQKIEQTIWLSLIS